MRANTLTYTHYLVACVNDPWYSFYTFYIEACILPHGQTRHFLSLTLYHYTKQILTPFCSTVCYSSPSTPYLPSNVWSIMNKFIWGKHLTGTAIVLVCVLRASQKRVSCSFHECCLQHCAMYIQFMSIAGSKRNVKKPQICT